MANTSIDVSILVDVHCIPWFLKDGNLVVEVRVVECFQRLKMCNACVFVVMDKRL